MLDLLFPRLCLACDGTLGRGAELLLCARCRGQIRPVRPESVCATCLRTLPSTGPANPRCIDCLRRPRPLRRIVALWWYEPPLDLVIRALKYRRLEFLARPLVEEALAREPLARLETPDMLVPVPLSPLRRWRRGFNQAESLAAAVGWASGLPLVGALRRSPLPQVAQARLGRRERLSRDFSCQLRVPQAERDRLRDGSVLLMDDVVTTGSTLAACAELLVRYGARKVDALVLAATPRHALGGLPRLLDTS